MLSSQFLSVAAKHLGRGRGHLQTNSTRVVSVVSRPSAPRGFRPNTTSAMDTTSVVGFTSNSSSNNNKNDNNNNNNTFRRQFSDMHLRRPPSKNQKNGPDSDKKQKWRSHAVSLGFGNYGDDYDYDETNVDVGASLAETPSSSSSTSSWHEEEYELAEQVQDIQREDDERRKRWLENAKPPVRHPVIDERGRSYGRGGRKTASARVWIQPGFGNVVVNRKDFVHYFGRASDRELILEPLAATETLGRFDITATVEGGGLRGQAGAVRHGLARALNHYNPDAYRPPLKRLGYLTRDPRKVERKKIGHLKARKKPQWVKR